MIFAIISIWVLIIVAFGIYWHALKISQKLTQCLTLLEKIVEGTKKYFQPYCLSVLDFECTNWAVIIVSYTYLSTIVG